MLRAWTTWQSGSMRTPRAVRVPVSRVMVRIVISLIWPLISNVTRGALCCAGALRRLAGPRHQAGECIPVGMSAHGYLAGDSADENDARGHGRGQRRVSFDQHPLR